MKTVDRTPQLVPTICGSKRFKTVDGQKLEVAFIIYDKYHRKGTPLYKIVN